MAIFVTSDDLDAHIGEEKASAYAPLWMQC